MRVVVVVGETRCDLRQVEEAKKVETKHGGERDQRHCGGGEEEETPAYARQET